MDRVEPAEGKDHIGGVACAWQSRQRHRREKRAQIRDAIIRHSCDNNEMILRRHGASRNSITPFPPRPPGLEPLTVSSRLRAGIPEVEREIDQSLRVPIHLAEIEAL